MKLRFYPTGNPNVYDEHYAPIKVITDSFLDEMLDTSAIELRDTDRREPYAPFTIVLMGTKPYSTYWMVGSDIVQEVRATGFYNHTVQLIEPTKWLERWMVGSKTVTQPICTSYIKTSANFCYGDGAVDHKYTEETYEKNGHYSYDKLGTCLKSDYLYDTYVEKGEKIPIYTYSIFDIKKPPFRVALVILLCFEYKKTTPVGWLNLLVPVYYLGFRDGFHIKCFEKIVCRMCCSRGVFFLALYGVVFYDFFLLTRINPASLSSWSVGQKKLQDAVSPSHFTFMSLTMVFVTLPLVIVFFLCYSVRFVLHHAIFNKLHLIKFVSYHRYIVRQRAFCSILQSHPTVCYVQIRNKRMMPICKIVAIDE